MKKISALVVSFIVLFCLCIFLEIIHTPIFYGKRVLTLVGREQVSAFSEEDLKEFQNIKISKVAYYAFKEMVEQAQKEGIMLTLAKGYEPLDPLFLDTSFHENFSCYEHAIGLAVDFASLTSKEEQWLEDNTYQYGFILRYPVGKQVYTKVPANPYHYRYVGVMDATIMHKKKICLEEYLKG